MHIEIKLNIEVAIKQEGEWYVACCTPLNLFAQGKTKAKAQENLIETLQLFFMSCIERGTLEQVLHESGFRPGLPRRRHKGAHAVAVEVPVPMHLISSNNHEVCPV